MQQTNFNELSKKEQAVIFAMIKAEYPKLTKKVLSKLVDSTTVKGAKFISLKDYNSNQSDNTKLANYLVNIGISYENMLKKDNVSLSTYNAETIKDVLKENVINHKYTKYYDLSLFTNPTMPHIEILDMLPAALNELIEDANKPKEKTDNNIKLNPVLWFNTKSKNLLIFGAKIKEDTTNEGTFKIVKSKPMTVAKNIIRNTLKKDTLRTFIVDNVLTSIVSKGEILELV